MNDELATFSLQKEKHMPERAVFPLPESYSLVCPYCRVWKMQPYRLAGIDGYRCIDHPLMLKCGKFISRTDAESYYAMMMIKDITHSNVH